jgi:membrane-bound lytic murein transglycosylase B
MSIYRRFAQVSSVFLMLAGCANTAPPSTSNPTNTPQAQAVMPTSTAPKPSSSAPSNNSAIPPSQNALQPELQAFAETLAAERNLPLAPIVAALADARYSPTVARLIAPAPPGKKIWRSWNTYRDRFVEPKRIKWGIEFWQENEDALNKATQHYGVPASIIVSIIGVETLYGRNMGNFRVLDALTTLAFNYPDPTRTERIRMFREQLADFITLVLEDKLTFDAKGSFAGAIGMPQFMPTSIKHYAVDGDRDGHIKLSSSREDSIMSVGNFLVEHGWLRGLPVFVPVVLPSDPSALASGGLTPTQTWKSLQAAGARMPAGQQQANWQDKPLEVINLIEEARGTAQYRTATPNFFALTSYNRSYFYATAVSDLASELEAKMPR